MNKNFKRKVVVVVSAGLLVAGIGVGMFGCKKESVQGEEKTLPTTKEQVKIDVHSRFISKILNIANIQEIIFREGECKIFFKDGKTGNYKFSEPDKLITVNLEKNYYELTFKEEGLIVKDKINETEATYSIISDISENIDKTIISSIALAYYVQEYGALDYKYKEDNKPYEVTHLCAHVRKSYCTDDMLNKAMEEHCGGKPSYVGSTDCGCLWGDFYCVCLTDFKC
jgi:hypothetical protein